MHKAIKISVLVVSAAFAGASVVSAPAEHHEGGDQDGPPPAVSLVPPEGTEQLGGIEMTGDPGQDFPIVLKAFHGMMDSNRSGELSLDELASWAHPGPMYQGMPPEDMRHQIEEQVRHEIHMEMRDEMLHNRREHLANLRHAIEEAKEHEQNIIRGSEEHANNMKVKLQETREHIASMQEELKGGEEVLAKEETEGDPE